LAECLAQKKDLQNDLSVITHGRAICRTDCSSKQISSLNLPRTESVSEEEALDFMSATLKELGAKGVRTDEICFLVHKFIPASAAAWAVAYPNKQIVRVDTLWGLPDGLQYLPHDTFEFDVIRKEISAERIRYKPKFLQETPDGSWRIIEVGRQFTRHRSLSKPDLAEVALQTHSICQRIQRPIQIMWFCGIPEELEMGRNVPWFSMPPETSQGREPSISPAMPRFVVGDFDDLEKAEKFERGKCVLYVNPENPDLFRSADFLDRIGVVAGDRAFPIVIVGSILGHAFYMLDRKGLAVVAADEPVRSRTRQRRVFNKIVRDQIPDQISQHGERTALATIAKGEARPALAVKLLEELFELLEAQTPNEVTAELADVLEVVRSLCAATGVNWEQVEAFAAAKRDKRGSFDRNVVLVETSWPTREDKNIPSTPISIKLSDLGQARSDGSTHRMPFSALLANDGDREVILSDGRSLTVEMDGNGITFEEGGKISASLRQLELDL
jgi:predicted house-cleaning noncanonical NTP pyrophosphatase (MazG superfamily)